VPFLSKGGTVRAHPDRTPSAANPIISKDADLWFGLPLFDGDIAQKRAEDRHGALAGICHWRYSYAADMLECDHRMAWCPSPPAGVPIVLIDETPGSAA
jgi:hypothetical protein